MFCESALTSPNSPRLPRNRGKRRHDHVGAQRSVIAVAPARPVSFFTVCGVGYWAFWDSLRYSRRAPCRARDTGGNRATNVGRLRFVARAAMERGVLAAWVRQRARRKESFASTRAAIVTTFPCSARGRCVEAADGPACAESAHACDAVRSAYNLWLQKLHPLIARAGSDSPPASAFQNSQCPEACKVSAGHCAQGLDTCWFVAHGSDPELDRLAALHESLGCPAMAPCVCPPVPDISCQVDSSGAAGAYPGPPKCMIR